MIDEHDLDTLPNVSHTGPRITWKINQGSYSDLSAVELAWALRCVDLPDIRQQEIGRFLAFVVLSDAEQEAAG